MKRINFFCMLMAAAAISSCSSDDIVDKSAANFETADNAMSFSVNSKNMSRAGGTAMEKLGMYNFGVWAYKTTTATPNTQTVMDNYLVGYHGADKGYAGSSSTLGESDNLTDATSWWFYEGLGNAEYTNTAAPYILKSETAKMSNNAYQYMKYWDYSATQVDFYAYAPYVNGSSPVQFTYDTQKMVFPELTAGTDASLANYMIAGKVTRKPTDADYKNDVPLSFSHITGQLKLSFWENIPGYDVEMIDCTVAGKNGVVAQGEVKTSGAYTYDFSVPSGSFSGDKEAATLVFAIPAGSTVAEKVKGTDGATHSHAEYSHKIGETSGTASPSETVYFFIPNDDNGSLTFHVSFKLHSLDTDEVITVTDATVVVPAESTAWDINKIYTYRFCITKNANGATNPELGPAGLYPIVFDQVQVAEWLTNTKDFDISDNTVSLPATKTINANPTNLTVELGNLATTASKEILLSSTIEAVATVPASVEPAADSYSTTIPVTPVAAGTSVITAINNGVKATCVVTVPLTISTTDTWTAGATGTLSTNTPAGASVTWSVTDGDTVASVDAATGEVTIDGGAGAGDTAEITATYVDARGETHTQTYDITVE